MIKSKVYNSVCSLLPFMQKIGGNKNYAYVCIKQHWKDKQELNFNDYLQRKGNGMNEAEGSKSSLCVSF